MIYSINDFEDYLGSINEHLFKLEEENRITYFKRKQTKVKLSFDFYNNVYNGEFLTFPLTTRPFHEGVSLDEKMIRYYEYKYGLEENTKNVEQIEKEISDVTQNDIPYLIDEYIREKIFALIHQYNEVLNDFKKQFYFSDNTEEKVLLINLLNHYKKIKERESEQLVFFAYINLDKTISDIILDIYIDFIEKRLNLLNPQEININNNKLQSRQNRTESLKKITWRGNQKELAELFIQLQRKGWIENIDNRDFMKTSKSICHLFDITHTKRHPDSDEVASFNQLLKGQFNRKTREFFLDFEEKYIQKFNKITLNNIN